MTRKDFEKFAAMFAGEIALAKCDGERNAKMSQIRNIVLSTADIFAQANPRFDREKFYAACGL